MTETAKGPPVWLARALEAEPFDVRPILAGGEDPFHVIMTRVEGVDPGGFLVVDAPFNPSPLRRVLAGRGFSSYARKMGEGHWRTFFHADGGAEWQDQAEVEVGPEGAMTWREEDGIHIDVRMLKPPMPLRAIVRLVEATAEDATIVVHHERDPVFLYPELAERGWRVARKEDAFANIRLWLVREG